MSSTYETVNQLEVLVASNTSGWVVLEAPHFNIFENRSIDRTGTVFYVPKFLRLELSHKIESKGIHVYSSVNISVFAYDFKHTREKVTMFCHPMCYPVLILQCLTRDSLTNIFIVP